MQYLRQTLLALLLVCLSQFTIANEEQTNQSTEFDPLELIAHHIGDAHTWHVFSYTDTSEESHHISIPLPIILFYEGHLYTFMSSVFNHDNAIVKKGNTYFKLLHEKIYITDAAGLIQYDENHQILNKKPLDFSITRNVASMWLSVLIIVSLFLAAAKKYKGKPKTPRGLQSFLEPLILFVRDDIAISQIGKEKADRFMPYLLTLFFFIWINNLIGLIPFFPGGSNLTGNISLTMLLALITFVVTNINGSKTYWKHIFVAPGIPGWVKIFLVPVEFIGIFTKPFALMIRLLANITAGHIIILSLFSLIFVMKSLAIAPVSIIMALMMFMLELLVAVLQAYIFTLLTALFIGMALIEDEHY